jgi:hypothetical protein
VAVNRTADQQILERIRAEYLEMPGLSLKAEQVQRLRGVERELCKNVLDALVETRFLRLKSDGAYGRLIDGEIPRPLPAKVPLESKALLTASQSRGDNG